MTRLSTSSGLIIILLLVVRFVIKTFKLSNMGRQALISHATGKSHKKHFDRNQFFFKLKNSEQSKACSSSSQNNTPIEIEKDNEPTVVNQPSIKLMLKGSQK